MDESHARWKVSSESDCAVECASYGLFLSELGKHEEAEQFIERALELDNKAGKGDPWSKSLCAMYFNEIKVTKDDSSNETKKVGNLYKEALKQDPTNPLGLGNWCIHLHRAGGKHLLAARDLYEKYLSLYPDHGFILTKKGNLFNHHFKHFELARECYQSALTGNPDNVECLSNFAVLEHGTNQSFEHAEELYRAALSIDPYHLNTLSNFGLFLAEVTSDFDGAEKVYQRALQLNPKHSNTLYNYAILLDSKGNKIRAEELYRKAVKYDSQHTYAWYNLALLLEENGDESGCENSFREALRCEPNDPVTLTDFGNFLFRVKNDAREAKNHVQKALNITSFQYAPALTLHSELSSYLGHFELR